MLLTSADSAAAAFRAGAAVWQQGAVLQDSLSLHRSVVDSVVIRSPLPDPLVPVVQWLFQKPGWLMLSGLVFAAVLGITVIVLAWRRRRAIGRWVVTRDRWIQLALGGGLLTFLGLAIATGWKGHHYVLYDNDFCRGCHIFVPSGRIVERPDTGAYLLVNAVEGKHDTLSCHACHPFELKAQTRTLIAWMTDRPEEIPPHGKVPRRICEQCHVQGAAKETWQRITTTAGHRVHLESDSLQGTVDCLSCHAPSAHRFVPTDSTCANQQGCHLAQEVAVKLGKMAGQTDLHCARCHPFSAEVPRLATRDSAAGTLVPGSRQCLACHAMQDRLREFDPAKDPHSATCGMCHNPHTNVQPKDAIRSCASAQCHAAWRDVVFHAGAAHRRVSQRCELCHTPHAARVDASDCTGCHDQVRERSRGRFKPPVPFDTTEALQPAAEAQVGDTTRLVRQARSLGSATGW